MVILPLSTYIVYFFCVISQLSPVSIGRLSACACLLFLLTVGLLSPSVLPLHALRFSGWLGMIEIPLPFSHPSPLC